MSFAFLTCFVGQLNFILVRIRIQINQAPFLIYYFKVINQFYPILGFLALNLWNIGSKSMVQKDALNFVLPYFLISVPQSEGLNTLGFRFKIFSRKGCRVSRFMYQGCREARKFAEHCFRY